MSNDHHNVADIATHTAAGAIAMEVGRHAGAQPQHGSAAGQDPSAAPSGLASDGGPAQSPPGLGTPRAPERRRRARSASTARDRGGTSRSPRGSAAAETRVPDSPDWHDAKPGPTCSVEELRFWTIREVGRLQETARLTGGHIAWLLKEAQELRASKAEAVRVDNELGRLRGDVAGEFTTMRNEFTQKFQELGDNTKGAFQQVSAVEASLQGHVAQGFAEAVAALQWLGADQRALHPPGGRAGSGEG